MKCHKMYDQLMLDDKIVQFQENAYQPSPNSFATEANRKKKQKREEVVEAKSTPLRPKQK